MTQSHETFEMSLLQQSQIKGIHSARTENRSEVWEVQYQVVKRRESPASSFEWLVVGAVRVAPLTGQSRGWNEQMRLYASLQRWRSDGRMKVNVGEKRRQWLVLFSAGRRYGTV